MGRPRTLTNADGARLAERLRTSWGSTRMFSRERLKPEIPSIGNDGIPIRDELELPLPDWPAFVKRYSWPQS